MGYTSNGLATANGGVIERINGYDVEILSHHFHNPYCNIICIYFMEDGKKVELIYFRYPDGSDGLGISYFKNKDSIQHYYSRAYTRTADVPKKYVKYIDILIQIYQMIDFEKYTKRPAH